MSLLDIPDISTPKELTVEFLEENHFHAFYNEKKIKSINNFAKTNIVRKLAHWKCQITRVPYYYCPGTFKSQPIHTITYYPQTNMVSVDAGDGSITSRYNIVDQSDMLMIIQNIINTLEIGKEIDWDIESTTELGSMFWSASPHDDNVWYISYPMDVQCYSNSSISIPDIYINKSGRKYVSPKQKGMKKQRYNVPSRPR